MPHIIRHHWAELPEPPKPVCDHNCNHRVEGSRETCAECGAFILNLEFPSVDWRAINPMTIKNYTTGEDKSLSVLVEEWMKKNYKNAFFAPVVESKEVVAERYGLPAEFLDGICPDCKGTRQYLPLVGHAEPCKTCCK